MVCVQCGGKTRVINSRLQKRNNQIWRRRRCLVCKAIFTSEESASYGGAWMVKSKAGRLQPFSRDKLLVSLYGSLGHRKTALGDAGALTDTAIRKLSQHVQDGALTSQSIVQIVQVALNRFDSAASVHYRAFHNPN